MPVNPWTYHEHVKTLEPLLVMIVSKESVHTATCMCSPCFWAREKPAAAKIVASDTDVGFVKNLFQTVQGVKFDDKCPHGLPYYACMPCSH